MSTKKLWVAKDEYAVRCKLFAHKPKRRTHFWADCGPNARYENVLLLDSDLFSDLKWEDEPVEVDIVPKGYNALSLWKEIKDEKPKEKGLYLTYSKSNGINIAFWNNSWCSCGETINTDSITHWTSLPNKPID